MIDDIMTALGYMEQKKQVQNDEDLANSISSKQSEIARRLVPVFIRSNKVDKGSMDNIKQQLSQWNVYPYKALNGGLKDVFYNLLFRFPKLLIVLRPLLIKFFKH